MHCTLHTTQGCTAHYTLHSTALWPILHCISDVIRFGRESIDVTTLSFLLYCPAEQPYEVQCQKCNLSPHWSFKHCFPEGILARQPTTLQFWDFCRQLAKVWLKLDSWQSLNLFLVGFPAGNSVEDSILGFPVSGAGTKWARHSPPNSTLLYSTLLYSTLLYFTVLHLTLLFVLY